MQGAFGGRANWGLVLGLFGLFATTPALSADLGGDCCADLEERVAELEATTARKGNRKVSLTVSGWVNEAIFAWDDGQAHGVYQGTNSLEQSRFRFTGEAKIDKDWSAGYVLELGVQGFPSSQFSQNHDGSTNALFINDDDGNVIRKSYWFIKSKDLGQVSVGQNGTATYHLLDDADATNTRSFADAEAPAVYMGGFFTRTDGTLNALKWSDIMRGFNNSTPGQDGRRPVVRYDSPAFMGFSLAAAWGQAYQWDVALTYKGEWNGIKLLARAGYGSSNDPGSTPVLKTTNSQSGTLCGGTQPDSDPANLLFGYDCTWGGAAATIMHMPTGLYVYGGWGRQQFNDFFNATGKITLVPEEASSTWFIQPGIEHKWLPIGKTTIFGQYRHDDPGTNPGKTIEGSINFWQGGVVQNIDAAAMDLYVIYQHTDGSVLGCSNGAKGNCPAGSGVNGVTNLDAFQQVIMGGLIQF